MKQNERNKTMAMDGKYNTLITHDYWFKEIQALRRAVEILGAEEGCSPEWDKEQFDFVARKLNGEIMKLIDVMRGLMKPISKEDYDRLTKEFNEMAQKQ